MTDAELLAKLQRIAALPRPGPLTFGYTNHHGEHSTRSVTDTVLWFGTSDYHPGEQWLLFAHDTAKGDKRTFAVKDMTFPEETQ